jgi:hypothetical protein
MKVYHHKYLTSAFLEDEWSKPASKGHYLEIQQTELDTSYISNFCLSIKALNWFTNPVMR